MQLSNKMNTYSSPFVNGQCSDQLHVYRFYLICVGFCGYNFKFWYMMYISGWIRSRCCPLESNYFAFYLKCPWVVVAVSLLYIT